MAQKKSKLKPLKIKCTDVDCENGMHCFRPTRNMIEDGTAGRCRSCKADLVDWDRLYRRDVADIEYTFDALRREYFRKDMWTKPIDQHAKNYARRKGLQDLREAAANRLTKYVKPRASDMFRDGMQTPLKRNPICYAQHSTATCCRKCIEYWHGIPQDQELSDDDISYFLELVMAYIMRRLPTLSENGEHVPPIRQTE